MATVTDLQRKDYAGNLLPVSGAFTKLVTGTSAAEALSGTAGNDVFQAGAGDTLSGGAGDDTYVVQYRDQVVIEKPGQGVDTVKTTSSYILPDNVENLYASGLPIVSGASVTGNSQANIIIGDSNPQIIAGAGGNDVLTGGGGSDTFLFGAGSGHDVISDFQTGALAGGGDVLRLQDYTLKGLSDLKAAMTQVGADVVLKLSSTDDVTFRNVKVGDFTAANFQPALDRSQLKLAFGDEFSAATLDLKTASNPDGKWIPEYGFGGIGSKASHYVGVYTGEQQIYVDPSYKGSGKTALGLDPFQLDSGILTIGSGVIPDADKGALYNTIPYYSGMLRATSGQTYGYFEMRAQFPSQSGSWPAFWLTPAANASREIDIFEHYGNEDYIRTTVHDTALANGATGQLAYVPDSTTAFHTYGMKWTAQTLTWYVDGQQVFQTATPADMNGPMYMNINLAVGGSLAGAVDSNNMPVGYKIDYVRAYSLADAPQTSDPQPAVPQPALTLQPVTSLTASANTLVANLASYAANTALQSITVSDKAPLTLSLAQMTQYASVLDKIAGGYSLAVSDTAANVTAALDSLQANSRVGTIQLTDAHVLSVGSVAAMQSLISRDAQALAKIEGGYSFAVTQTKSDFSQTTSYDATGHLTATTTSILSSGVLKSQGTIFADGSSNTKLYTSTVLTSEFVTHADKSKDVYFTNVVNKSYVSEHDTYNSVGVLVESTRTHTDGSLDYHYVLASDGTKITDHYDANGASKSHVVLSANNASHMQSFTGGVLISDITNFSSDDTEVSRTKLYTNGVLTSEFDVHADNSKDVYFTNVANKSYVTEHDAYNSNGLLTRVERTHQDGTLDYSYSVLNGNKSTSVYDAAGVIKSSNILHADGSSEHKVYTAGQLTSETDVHADQSRDTFQFNFGGQPGASQHLSFDAAGLLTMSDVTGSNRTHTQTVFVGGQTLVSTAGAADSFISHSKGGDTFVFKAGSGSDVITGFHVGEAVGHDIIQIDSALAHSLADLSVTTSGADTLIHAIHADMSDTILLKGITPASLTHSDFLFA